MSITFKGIEEAGFGGYSLTDQISTNLKFWIDHNLLSCGGFEVYTIGQDSYFANDESNFRVVVDGRYPTNCVWEGVGHGFVWESGVSVPSGSTEPFRVSGINWNGNFISINDVGPHRFHVDYINGRIIFDESQSETDVISANYCSRSVYLGFADSSEFQNLMLESIEEFLSNTVPSGTASKEHQVWLPAIFIEIQSGKGKGLQLGGGQIKEKVIVLHIFCDTVGDRNFLLDTLDFQNRAAFWLGDLNQISLPFDFYGDVLSGTTNFIDLMNAYPYRKLRIIDGTCKIINSLNTKLFRGQVRWNIEVDLGNI